MGTVQGILVVYSLRWGRGGGAAKASPAHRLLELLWVLIPTAVLVALVVFTWSVAKARC